jgi:Ca2+-binding RTX toxin-like protein
VTGDAGDNSLVGGADADSIEGFGGSDTMTGGGGADVFVFKPGLGATNFASIARIGSIQGQTVAGLTDEGAGTVTYSFGFTTGTVTAGNVAGTLTVGGLSLNSIANGTNANSVPAILSGTNIVGPIVGNTTIPYGAAVTYGTGASVPLGSTAVAAAAPVTFVSPDYGYSTTGVDVITDFQQGIDQIRISSSLSQSGNPFTTASPGNFTSFAGVGTNLSTAPETFIYDSTTGLLYYNPTNGVGVGQVGANFSTPSVSASVVSLGTNFADSVNAGTNQIFGVIDAANTKVSEFGGVALTLNYQFGTGVAASVGAEAEIPFLQVLNNGAPVGSLVYSTDITIF